MWERITGQTGRLDGQVVAEYGCGSGRFIETLAARGAIAIGLDLSTAVEAAAQNFRGNPNVLICQADVMKPPLKPRSIDGAFSIGVLHHTVSPSQGVSAMAHCVKPGGWVATCVYPKGGYYDHPLTTIYRRFFRFLKPIGGYRLPLAYAYFASRVLNPLSRIPVAGMVIKASFPFARIPDRRWSFLDTFDSLTPEHQTTHETFEVFEWFRKAGLINIEPGDWGPTAFHGRLPVHDGDGSKHR
jgi:SAM-dependent methyltransferase